ncbi:Acetyltransferase (isoleucine patch superfamily) [Mucilaginibacter sp. OK268]|uniref:CatB-related O-acetyltransferase n=1 Tax=Mucilaginibacter sp. OK268 TaxID=1881048 RepID=UPI00088F8EA0|nr:CatB-related O-acetyltransferase [Mucilaginibacter sp. OK268]SDQ00095.1 Acetyltransferase (isoleucine patch superfamily) [Mucilaginibacter sp. OK268]
MIVNRIKKLLSFFLNIPYYANSKVNTRVGKSVKLYSIYKLYNVKVGDYTYIAPNSNITDTTIGKFCSIGPNLVCGLGIHPTNGISTAPMFYSNYKQNGITLCKEDKITENLPVSIGHDVFIGANVTILGGVTIGDGAVIGAGAVVSKNIPPYAIAVGTPIKIVKYRFDEDKVKELLKIKWWDWEEDKLPLVEKYIFNTDDFLKLYN